MANLTAQGGSRAQRIIAFMVASAVLLSVVSLVAVFIGAENDADFSQGIWPTVVVLPILGLPIAIILIVVFVVMTAIRRGRA